MKELIESNLLTDGAVTVSDPASVDWNSFKIKRPTITHFVREFDVIRPYMISYDRYGDTQYTDIIMSLNRIEDPFALKIGTSLIIPDPEDISDFMLEQKRLNFSNTQ